MLNGWGPPPTPVIRTIAPPKPNPLLEEALARAKEEEAAPGPCCQGMRDLIADLCEKAGLEKDE